MKLVYAISRWNNPNRSRGRHILKDSERLVTPLWGGDRSWKNRCGVETEEGTIEDVTCEKCKNLYQQSEAK